MTLALLWGKVVCFVKRKHQRGKLMRDMPTTKTTRAYQCPRCHAVWVRKVRNAAPL